MIKARTIWHLHLKSTDEHKYYGSMQALFNDNQLLGKSKFFFDRYDFSNPYDTEIYTIRKGLMYSTGQLKRLSKELEKDIKEVLK